MKRVIFSIIFTVAVIMFSLFSGTFIEERLIYLEKELNECHNSIISETSSSYEEKISNIDIYWNKNKSVIGLLANGEACKALDDEIKNLKLFIKSKNTSSALESISDCLNIILSVKENEKLTLKSVL